MSYTIGDGMVTLALAGGIVGYLYVKHLSWRKRMEIVHEERMAAMEKGIPLPEFPLEPARERRQPDPPVLPIFGNDLAGGRGWRSFMRSGWRRWKREYRCRSFRWSRRGNVVNPIRPSSRFWERF